MSKQSQDVEAYRGELVWWLNRDVSAQGFQTIEHTELALGTSTGAVRQENQDRVAVARILSGTPAQSYLLLALCDGMGGMEDGGMCATIALASLIMWFATDVSYPVQDRLMHAAQQANDEVHRHFGGRGGSTCACIAVDEQGHATALHVGDSRIYEYMVGGKAVSPLTVDDNIGSQVERMRASGESHVSEPSYFSRQITQFIGQGDGLLPTVKELPALNGRQYFITSDGAHTLPTTTLTDLISCAGSSLEAVRRVLAVSKWCKGEDNASMICARSFDVLGGCKARTGLCQIEVWDAFGKANFFLPAGVAPAVPAKRTEEKKDLPLPLGVLDAKANPGKTKPPRKHRASNRRRAGKAQVDVRQSEKPVPQIELINNE